MQMLHTFHVSSLLVFDSYCNRIVGFVSAGRPYGDSRGRPIDERYRDSPGSWERRHEYGRDRGRQYTDSHNPEGRTGDRRDNRGRPRDTASPERRERQWEEREGTNVFIFKI